MFILSIQIMCANCTSPFMVYAKLPALGSQNFPPSSGPWGLVKVRQIHLFFMLQKFNYVIYILIYVDDILITGSSVSVINNIIHSLQATIVVKDLGSLAYFLGIEALWCTDGMYLTQRKYIADLLKRSKMETLSPVPVQWPPTVDLILQMVL